MIFRHSYNSKRGGVKEITKTTFKREPSPTLEKVGKQCFIILCTIYLRRKRGYRADRYNLQQWAWEDDVKWGAWHAVFHLLQEQLQLWKVGPKNIHGHVSSIQIVDFLEFIRLGTSSWISLVRSITTFRVHDFE